MNLRECFKNRKKSLKKFLVDEITWRASMSPKRNDKYTIEGFTQKERLALEELELLERMDRAIKKSWF